MGKQRLKIGMAQMLVEGGYPEENLKRAAAMIYRAAKQHCDIIVLPECLDLGWTFPDSNIIANKIPGESSIFLAAASGDAGIYTVAGIVEKDNDKLYNSAVLISAKGEILSKYRKINILDIAQDLYSVGDRLLVTDTELGRIGVDICADNFPDSFAIGHTLGRMGADIILSPCSWAVSPENK